MSKARGITMLFASGAMVAGFGLAGAPAALADGPNTPPEVVAAIEAASWPELQEGQETWEVAVVKFLLVEYGYLDVTEATEVFDERLTEAVLEYQEAEGVDATGIVDEPTWSALTDDLGIVRQGDSGNLVKAVQYSLINGHGYDLDLDGQFGPATRDAVIDFQTGAEIDPDGEVGPITFQALLTPDEVSVD
ncbi:peptidoglycan-binding protein [Nocardiopsis sp. JB363]|uniref:peptidoglycan-binding domain-containing protein n=1 Tax=Nocardiopsis sp. JB363 TaxID=1434837 RepID=UPI00097AFAD3|nr:peptidoglycan-binding protein [Nocardiopsis sp. JB363]SIO90399.1 Peptidoglycan-binding domain 1 [Nocardiopsis sp. JB363]